VLALVLSVRASGRPVLIRERRLGRGDHEFDLLRFRCERPWSGAPRALDGPALTRTGQLLSRTGLDYLPQLFNLLKGELSLVGPRPQRPEVATILDQGRGLRSHMRPGITGPGQLAALRGPANPDARRDADDYYVRSWSLWLDARIIARTVFAAFRLSGD